MPVLRPCGAGLPDWRVSNLADPRELGGLLWERQAELAFSRMAEIEEAAKWCCKNGPHKLEFLNQMKKLLSEEEIHMTRMGLGDVLRLGIVKRTPVLTVLSPSQALRLLECHKRAMINTSRVWRAKSITDIDKLESDIRRDATIAEIRERLRQQRENGHDTNDS